MKFNWLEDGQRRSEHLDYTKIAIERFKANYPDRPVDITKAQEDYAEDLGLDKTHFRLIKSPKVSFFVGENMNLKCPECGAILKFLEPFQDKNNPQQYQGLFYCDEEDCTYHAYTKESPESLKEKLDKGEKIKLPKKAEI